jgi:hypothetical protein
MSITFVIIKDWINLQEINKLEETSYMSDL